VTSALPVPKYHQVYLVLREQLQEGRFIGGVPGEIALMQEFGVARVTVRKALERLAAEHLIRRTPGRGTVPLPIRSRRLAAASARPGGDDKRFGVFENLIRRGLAHTSRCCRCAPCRVRPMWPRRCASTPARRCKKHSACA
jgi:GntR family transcriptional regulator